MTTKRWGSALLTISLLAAACVPAGTDDEISATEASSSTSTGSLTGHPSDSDGTPPATTGPDPTSASTTSTSTGFDDTDPTAPTDTSTTGMTTNGGEAIPICGDGDCQALAETALLSNPSSYRAWLSSGAESPTTRITPPMGAYILPNGVQIAASWAELVDGTDLDSAIDVTQKKMPVAKPYRVWSNTAPTGASLQGPDCNGWTVDLVGITGSYGSTEDVDVKWTEADLDWCSQKNRLYCVATAG